MTELIYGPTFSEMRDPSLIDKSIRAQAIEALDSDPLNPINLFNITWKDPSNKVVHTVLPSVLTGVEAPIAVISGRRFPSGSHKVGAVYSILMELLHTTS